MGQIVFRKATSDSQLKRAILKSILHTFRRFVKTFLPLARQKEVIMSLRNCVINNLLVDRVQPG